MKKRKKQWAVMDSVMLKAIIVSIIVHFCVIYFIPSVTVFPPDAGYHSDAEYIEVDQVRIETGEEIAQKAGEREQQIAGEIPEQPQLDHIPTQLAAIDPNMVESRLDSGDWETTFVGREPRLPENFQTLAQVKQFKHDQPASIPIDISKERLFPAEEIAKQAPELESSQAEHDIQPHDDLLVTAEQRYENISRSQTIQIPEEKVSPGFTKLKTPELIENSSKERVSFEKIERISSEKTSPVMARGEIKSDKLDTLKTFSVRLPKTLEISEQAEAESIIPVDDTISIASLPPNVEALTKRFKPRSSDKDELEGLPKTAVPQITPISQLPRHVEQKELTIIPHPRTSVTPQDLPLSLTSFPHVSETKVTFTQNADVSEKQTIRVEETVKVAERPLPQKRLIQGASPQTFTDEPRGVHVQQDIQPERNFQRGTYLSPQLQHAGTKQSYVIGGESENDLVASNYPRFGIFVGKDMTRLQPQEPDVMVQNDDVLKRITTDTGKVESSLVIEGPASERKVIYKPARLPEVQIDIEVDIRLKFWVLPDGTVGEVIPLQRGDVRLERAAIQYLKSWRFTPVSPDKPKVWGIIPIKYKLK